MQLRHARSLQTDLLRVPDCLATKVQCADHYHARPGGGLQMLINPPSKYLVVDIFDAADFFVGEGGKFFLPRTLRQFSVVLTEKSE